VTLKDVHVSAVREVAATGDWRVIATAGGRPWIAEREVAGAQGQKAVWLWLASEPLAETDWPKDPGFVLFFAEMEQRALGGDERRYVDWLMIPEEPARGVRRETGLTAYLGVAAMALLAGAMLWFVRRGR
jgi:hypothetical protein